MNDDLISRSALKKALEVTQYNDIDDLTRTERLIDNAPTVEVPENTVNCVLTMFGKCSYNETGCSDCEIKDKIRKALNDKPQDDLISRSALKEHKFTTQVCNGVEIESVDVVAVATIDNAPTVLTISDNPTNGDMIKALFPDGKICITNNFEIGLRFKSDNWIIWFKDRWWNAPYKKEAENEND